MPINTHIPVAANKQTWLPPPKASLPNKLMVTANMATNTAIGNRDNKGEGKFL